MHVQKLTFQLIRNCTMGSLLGPLMTNVIMIELDRVVVKELFNKSYLKFYIRFMDDMLIFMKKVRRSHCFAST